MVDNAIVGMKSTRKNIQSLFKLWYKEALQLPQNVGSTEEDPKRTTVQSFPYNTPSESPLNYYRRTLVIPLLDNLINQLEQRFNGEEHHAGGMLNLISSITFKSEQEILLEV